MKNKKQRCVHQAIANASDLYVSLSLPGQASPAQAAGESQGQSGSGQHTAEIRSRVGKAAIRYEDERWIVTEIGFVLMAVLPGHARRVSDALVVPGVDDQNQRGYLVLRAGMVPYHSQAASPERAQQQAHAAAGRAARLVAHFGGREALREAARSTPWYFMSNMSDVYRAGLCSWGVDSWLRRIGATQLAYRTGLPRLFIRMAGGYGDRVTAMTLMRRELAAETGSIPTGLIADPVAPPGAQSEPAPGNIPRASPLNIDQHTARVSQI